MIKPFAYTVGGTLDAEKSQPFLRTLIQKQMGFLAFSIIMVRGAPAIAIATLRFLVCVKLNMRSLTHLRAHRSSVHGLLVRGYQISCPALRKPFTWELSTSSDHPWWLPLTRVDLD